MKTRVPLAVLACSALAALGAMGCAVAPQEEADPSPPPATAEQVESTAQPQNGPWAPPTPLSPPESPLSSCSPNFGSVEVHRDGTTRVNGYNGTVVDPYGNDYACFYPSQ